MQLICDYFHPSEEKDLLSFPSPFSSITKPYLVNPVDVLLMPFETKKVCFNILFLILIFIYSQKIITINLSFYIIFYSFNKEFKI